MRQHRCLGAHVVLALFLMFAVLALGHTDLEPQRVQDAHEQQHQHSQDTTSSTLVPPVQQNTPSQPEAPRYHFLFISFFGAGDFTPILNVMREAVRRGHRVSLLADNATSLATDLTGIHFYPYDDIFTPEEAHVVMQTLRSFSTPGEEWEFVMGELFPRWYREQLPALEQLLDRLTLENNSPDVLVAHAACVAPVDVAQSRNLRLVTIWPQPYPMPLAPILSTHNCVGRDFPLQLSFVQKVQLALCVGKTIFDMVQAAAPLQAERGSRGYSGMWPEMLAPYRQIYTGVPPLSRTYDYSPLTVTVGPLIDTTDLASAGLTTMGPFSKTKNDLELWLDDERLASQPVVVLAFGSTGTPTPAFLRALLTGFDRAFERLGTPHRLLLSCLWAPNTDADKQVDDNAVQQFVNGTTRDQWTTLRLERWIPQKQVLSHRSVVLFGTHCGFGSVSEGLYWGLPLLAYPFYFDQHDNANSVANARAGLVVSPHTASAPQISSAAEQLLAPNNQFAERARLISRVMRRAGGIAKAIDVLEEEAETGSEHLQPDPNHYYDLLLVSLLVAWLLLWLLWRLVVTIFRCLCCRTSKPKPKPVAISPSPKRKVA